MKRNVIILAALFAICTLNAEIYVWKGGLPILSDPDSITFVKPEMSAQVQDIEDKGSQGFAIRYLFLTKDYMGKPQWQSALLNLTADQYASKHIGKMVLYNHYTIMRDGECPTAGELWDMQMVPFFQGFAVVSADYEGFGATADRPQAYCFGEANARASIDALLAAREWLRNEGYTLSDTIVNIGYSQGGQTTIAALKLSQTEYKGKVHFLKSIAGDGPYFLSLTYQKYIEWEENKMPSALTLTFITLNELLHLGLKYKDVFIGKLADSYKMWFLSKKFDTTESSTLIEADSIKYFVQPAYCDSTTQEAKKILHIADSLDFTKGWTPDKDTNLKIYHSKNDEVVPFENGRELYQFFQRQGCEKVAIDSTSLSSAHQIAGQSFAISLMQEFTQL